MNVSSQQSMVSTLVIASYNPLNGGNWYWKKKYSRGLVVKVLFLDNFKSVGIIRKAIFSAFHLYPLCFFYYRWSVGLHKQAIEWFGFQKKRNEKERKNWVVVRNQRRSGEWIALTIFWRSHGVIMLNEVIYLKGTENGRQNRGIGSDDGHVVETIISGGLRSGILISC